MISFPTTTPHSTPWVASPTLKATATPRHVAPLLHRFSPITLDEMDGVALLNRIDTKYLIPMAEMPALLLALASHYRVLEIGGSRIQAYRTLYFDTPDFALYQRHHAGGRNRYKVRSRTYLDSDLSFVEVKRKTNKKQTIKNRLQTSEFATHFTDESCAFLSAYYPLDPYHLESKLYNDYSRISLVGKRHDERLTLDLGLRFWNEADEAEVSGIVIAELKQAAFNHTSPFVQLMRNGHLRAGSFSKYAMGATLLYPALKQNRFKEEHRRIAKLQEGAFRDHC